MKDILYMQTDKNMKIFSGTVYLQDISRLSSTNPRVLNACSVLPVITLPEKKYGRYTASAIDLIRYVQQHFEDIQVVHIGEPEFILTYENPKKKKCNYRMVQDNSGMSYHFFWNYVFYYDI